MSRAQSAPTTNMQLAARAFEVLYDEFPGGASPAVLADELFEPLGHVHKALAYLRQRDRITCDRINGQWIYQAKESPK